MVKHMIAINIIFELETYIIINTTIPTFSGENRKIFHEQECEKTLITLLSSEVSGFMTSHSYLLCWVGSFLTCDQALFSFRLVNLFLRKCEMKHFS